MVKNTKGLVNTYCQREKIPNPFYDCTLEDGGFLCTVNIGDETFTTPVCEKTRKAAEMAAAKMVCDNMNISEKPGVKVVKDPDWISIAKTEDIYKYLTDEELAQEFISFLRFKAREENKGCPSFTTNEVNGKYYTASVFYDGVIYSSLGPMVTKVQAEQSAAEACLRTLGDFPNVAKDKYTIQQYRGGQVKWPPRRVPREQQRGLMYRSRPMYRSLYCRGRLLKLQIPILMHKVDSSGEIPLYTVVLQSEGKRFKSKTPAATLSEAVEEASIEALKYYGVTNPEETCILTESIDVREESKLTKGLKTPSASPLEFCPSKHKVWGFHYYESTDEMTGKEFLYGDDLKNIIVIKPPPTQNATEIFDRAAEIFDRAMKVEPSIEGTSLSDCDDIVVAEVKTSNKNNTVVGNQNFSSSMFVENGKILSTKEGSLVDLVPGLNIRGLKCSYQLMYPSLQVYLKAESCTEVTKPKKPLPVVTACGVAMLIHDHEAHSRDINILLTRSSANPTFMSRVNYLKAYLNGIITANTSMLPWFAVTECVININTWTAKEVRLMSEMTVESMKELLSAYVRFDERWSELFEEKQTDELKELKEAAVAEVLRRETAGVVNEEVEGEWCLPMTPFRHYFSSIGIPMENNVRCAFRSAMQITGIKVKLADLEESPFVDVPVSSTNKGAVCRYYIWKGLRTVSGDEQEPYYEAPTDVTAELGEGWVVTVDQHRGKPKFGDDRIFDNLDPWWHKKRPIHHDNDTGNGVSQPKKRNTEVDGDIAEVPEPVDENQNSLQNLSMCLSENPCKENVVGYPWRKPKGFVPYSRPLGTKHLSKIKSSLCNRI